MAKLNGPLSFTGQLGDIVGYRRKDLEGTCLRATTSLNKERIHTDPAFANSRRTAEEAGGRSKAAKWLRRMLHSLDPVRVGNWQAQFTKVLTPLQRLDTQGLYGQRDVLFSRYGQLLEGLCLSSRTPFEGLVRNLPSFTLSKDQLQAEVVFPALTQGVNFFAPDSLAYFRVAVVLGAMPDLLYTPGGYKPEGDYNQLYPAEALSDWYPVKGGAPATAFQLQLPKVPPNDSFGLVLAVGLLFGTVNQWGQIEPVKYQGSGRILAVV